MVHGKYHVPEKFIRWSSKYLGKISFPVKTSLEAKIIEKRILDTRRKSIKFFTTKMGLDVLEYIPNLQQEENSDERVNQGTAVGEDEEEVQMHANCDESENLLLKETRQVSIMLRAMQSDLHYLFLERMNKTCNPEEIAKEEWKSLAVIMNRFVGIILTIINVGLIAYTGIIMAYHDDED